jgi:hypothetical protein
MDDVSNPSPQPRISRSTGSLPAVAGIPESRAEAAAVPGLLTAELPRIVDAAGFDDALWDQFEFLVNHSGGCSSDHGNCPLCRRLARITPILLECWK